MQQIAPVEDALFRLALPVIEGWRQKGSIDRKELE